MKITTRDALELLNSLLYLHVCFRQCFAYDLRFISKIRIDTRFLRLTEHFLANIEYLIAYVRAWLQTSLLFGD